MSPLVLGIDTDDRLPGNPQGLYLAFDRAKLRVALGVLRPGLFLLGIEASDAGAVLAATMANTARFQCDIWRRKRRRGQPIQGTMEPFVIVLL